jgi:phospholipid transport system substrate-binding protein
MHRASRGAAKDHVHASQAFVAQHGRADGIVRVSVRFCGLGRQSGRGFRQRQYPDRFDILNDHTTSPLQRRERFASFLLGLTDVKRVALFMLGRYAAAAPQADLDAYVAAYQEYTAAIYQSYFALYSGQSLHVTSSRERAPGDFVVAASVTGQGTAPLEIDFRIRTDGAKPVLMDLGVAGVWLASAQRDEFLSFVAQNNGDIKALTAHLRTVRQH